MEISTELVVAVLGVITGILGWLGKKKYAKIAEVIIKGVNEYVDNSQGAEKDADAAKKYRKKVKKSIKAVADIIGINHGLDKLKNRIEKKIFKKK